MTRRIGFTPLFIHSTPLIDTLNFTKKTTVRDTPHPGDIPGDYTARETPPEVTPTECSKSLKAKMENYY